MGVCPDNVGTGGGVSYGHQKGPRTCQVGASVNGRSQVNVVKANKVTESWVMVPGLEVTVSDAVFTD